MTIVVRTRIPIGQQIWSWVVVGAVIVLGLGAGVTFTTSNHPWIADVCYVLSTALFIAKFFTWEDIRQQEPTRRRKANSLAASTATIILLLAIAGNHYLNRSVEIVVPNSPNVTTQSGNGSTTKPSPTPSSDNNAKTQPDKKVRSDSPFSESSSTPQKTKETNEAKDKISVKAQHHAPKDEMTATVDRSQQKTKSEMAPASSPITINNAPGGIAISGGNVNNPTVNNFGSPSRTISPDLRQSLRDLLAKHTATVRVFAVNDVEANEFAQQWYDLLVAAGWNMKDKQVILVQLERPWRGVRVGYRGEAPSDEKGLVSVPDNTPQAALVGALLSARIESISVNPKLDLDEGFIELLVSWNPRHN